MIEERPPQESRSELIETILKSIMTAEEYGRIWHEIPYKFVLRAGGKELHYFGSDHIKDQSSPIFSEIEESFLRANPEIVFVEGIAGATAEFEERIKKMSRNEVIEKFGEPSFTLKLAAENGIDWWCPEPEWETFFEELLGHGFTKDEIFVWYVLRSLNQYNAKVHREGYEKYASGYIERIKRYTNWPDFNYTFEHAMCLGEKIIGNKIDVENMEFNYVSPVPRAGREKHETVLNRVATASTLIRDRKIVSDIIKVFEKYNKVFIVYGASHAVMQEPALRKFFESIS